jgi:putative endonuclease
LNKNTNRYNFGIRAEFFACLILRLKGCRILARRYKTPLGEVDIIAARGNELIFIEVKARREMQSFEVLSSAQQKRIINAAKYFISLNKINTKICRFDLIIIKNVLSFQHIKNAFSANFE